MIVNYSHGVLWADKGIAGLNVSLSANPPDLVPFGPSGDLKIYGFDGGAATTEQVYFGVHLPHDYKQYTDIRPHIHWSPVNTDSGTVVWQLEYSWANVNSTYEAPTIITAIDASDQVAWKSQVKGFGNISGDGKKISSIIVCRLFRDPTHGTDDYGSDAAFIEFGIHYQKDAPGSTREYIK